MQVDPFDKNSPAFTAVALFTHRRHVTPFLQSLMTSDAILLS